ncbi:hypothetical protein ALO_19577 [Acetonema longum DSM 6540]|uniref:Uncharacterized protein n=2 Tax=Acetonema TaxID=2373 RepID=F7NP72_9FIRM|nr:hypothetical protein ALO_19577 [Acetonema longum DSM 6540]
MTLSVSRRNDERKGSMTRRRSRLEDPVANLSAELLGDASGHDNGSVPVRGKVDAILLTGGIAYSRYVTGQITSYSVSRIYMRFMYGYCCF